MQKFQLLLLTIACWQQLPAQNCSGGMAPSILTLSLAGKTSVDGFNDDDNTRGTLTAAFAGNVVGINYAGINLATIGSSWCVDAVVEIADVRNSASNYVDLQPSLQNGGSPCADLPFTEYFNLVALGFEFPTAAANKVYYELWEDFDDNTGTDATYTAGTVTIYVCPVGQSLPLELKYFAGQAEPDRNVLTWETLTEKNVQVHVVERSTDDVHWKEVGRTAGHSNSLAPLTYTLEDPAPLAKAYYRLRSVDFDGQENRSNAILLTRKGEVFGITSIFPSPATDRVTVQFSSMREENVVVRVLDITGREVRSQSAEALEDLNELLLPVEGLPAGIYTVTVANSAEVSAPLRFVKQ